MKRLVQIASIAFLLLLLSGQQTRGLAEPGDADHFQWLVTMMDAAYAIKPGMTVEEVFKVVKREGGGGLSRIMTQNGYEFRHTYVLRQCRIIKMDMKFEGKFTQEDPKPGSKLLWVSRPYLENEILD
jgi:hypothetical protein